MNNKEYLTEMGLRYKACEELMENTEGIEHRSILFFSSAGDMSGCSAIGDPADIANAIYESMMENEDVFRIVDAASRLAWKTKADKYNFSKTKS